MPDAATTLFEITPDQREMTRVLDAMLAAQADPRLAYDRGPAIDRPLWGKLAELGMAAVTLHGGTTMDQALIAERLGAAVAPVPVASVAAAAVVVSGTESPEPAGWLRSGERVVAAALSARSGVDLSVRATETTDGWRLSGAVHDLLEAAAAEYLLVPCDGVWFGVECSAPGVTLSDQAGLDQSQRLGSLTLEDAPAARLGGTPELGESAGRTAWLMLAAQATGAAERALSMSVEYAKTRQQFGQPIGKFQAIKHALVDMLLDVENARSATYNAAWAVDAGRDDRDLALHLAKAVATENAARVTGQAIQVHGGIGNTWEHDCHLLMRRAKACELALGDPDLHFQRIADRVIDDRDSARTGNSLISSAGDAELREELRTWLDENLPEGWGTPDNPLPRDEKERWEFLRRWQARMAEGRWVGIHWPVEYGGRNATIAQQIAYNIELSERRVPPLPGHRGLTIVGPTLIRHGTPEQRERFLQRLRLGQDLWAGGFSEPGAGSDLASLRTRGVIDGDTIVVNGQKIWTSQAHLCNWIFTLVRTDPDAPKHEGITVVLIPLDSPGITIRPIRRMHGGREFNEVFFDDVRVPVDNILGPVNEGWQVNRTTLSHEHSTLFVGAQVRYTRTLRSIVETSRTTIGYSGQPRAVDPLVRARIARSWAVSQLLLINGLRNVAKVTKDGQPGPEGSIMKLFGQEAEKAQHELALDVTGPAGLLDRPATGAVGGGKWIYGYLATRAATVGGGTSEIHRNKIGETVLGLPRDTSSDPGRSASGR
ncbi:MAG TPA: acyl-CoA dehydrogenase family protein [Amycolatopsis sp.]|nr:acyl-CoA dehydrogenase family protein [Amycolatopsis sp.]